MPRHWRSHADPILLLQDGQIAYTLSYSDLEGGTVTAAHIHALSEGRGQPLSLEARPSAS